MVTHRQPPASRLDCFPPLLAKCGASFSKFGRKAAPHDGRGAHVWRWKRWHLCRPRMRSSTGDRLLCRQAQRRKLGLPAPLGTREGRAGCFQKSGEERGACHKGKRRAVTCRRFWPGGGRGGAVVVVWWRAFQYSRAEEGAAPVTRSPTAPSRPRICGKPINLKRWPT